jgi:Domain of unknown function (DUF397)
MDMIPAPEWRTSSYSSGNGGNCVQVAVNLPGVVAVQDSKNPGPALVVEPASFVAFTAAIKNGEFAR